MSKSVLISGASSGIGNALSLAFDQQGYQVFAGVRNPVDAALLQSQASLQLTPVMLDITQPDMISDACKEVSEKTGGQLFCVINNAGISISGAMEFMPIQEFRNQLEVNLLGQLALTQGCLPMLRKSSGRIIFVSSAAGRMTTAFNGPYAASKAGLIAMADALRLELAPWKLYVSILIIGCVQTPIWEKGSRKAGEILRRMPPEARELYGKELKGAGGFYSYSGRTGIKVDKVVKTTQHLMEQAHPKEYVLIGQDAVLVEIASKLLPVRLRDRQVRRWMRLGKI